MAAYFLFTIGIWILLPISAHCQPDIVRQQIQEALNKADVSLEHKDISGCLAEFSEDFQGIDIDGAHFDKAQTKRSLIRHFLPNRYIVETDRVKSQVVTLISSGSQANVLYHEHVVVTITGQFTHYQDNLTFDAIRQSIWVKTDGRWIERREKQLTSRITQNGRLKSVKDSRVHSTHKK